MGRVLYIGDRAFDSSGDTAAELDIEIKGVNVQKAPTLWSVLYDPLKL